LIPQESEESNSLFVGDVPNFEIRLLDKLLATYKRSIEFFTSGKEEDQVKLAKKAFAKTLKLKLKFDSFWALNYEDVHTAQNL